MNNINLHLILFYPFTWQIYFSTIFKFKIPKFTSLLKNIK